MEIKMTSLFLALLFIATVQAKPFKDEDKGNFKYPGGVIPGNFLESREPDTLNGIHNKGGLGIGKTKREGSEEKPAEGTTGNGGDTNMSQFSNQMQQLQQQFNTFGGGNNLFIVGKKKQPKNKRSDEPAASGSTPSGSGGTNPLGNMNQMTSQWQNVVQNMNGLGGHMPFLPSNKEKRSDEPAASGSTPSGSGGSNPLGNMNQMTTQWQNVMQNMNGLGGHMPFLPSNKEKRSDEPAASGSTPSGSGGSNPLGNMNQMTTQWQNVMQNMNGLGGHMPFLPSNKEKRSDEPAASGSTPSGSGGSNPLGNMNQMTSQWQNVMQNMNGLGGHMPFLPSNKEKRSDEPAASGSTPSGSGGSNPLGSMNQMTSQWQNVMQNMNGLGGHMPFLPSNKEKRSDEPAASGSTPSGSGGSNPLGNMNQMTSQWQNVMQNMNGLGGHMPFLPSNKEKRSDEPAASGSGSGGSPVDMNQMTNQWQNVFQQMNGGVPGMGGGKPTEGSSGSGGGNNGNPLSNVNQVTEQFQGSVQQMNNGIPGMSGGGNMPFLPSNKEKRSDEPAASGSTPSGSGGSNPLGNMNQMTSQWQNVMQNMNGLGGHMPFLPSNKEKRSDEPAASGSTPSGSGGSNPLGNMNQMTSQWQNVMQNMNGLGGHMPFLPSNKEKRSDEPAASGSTPTGSGGSNPLGNMNQMTSQWQNVMQNMNGLGGHMPFLPSNKEKRSDEPAASGSTPSGSGGSNPLGNMNQMTSQWQNVMQNMNGLGGHMPFLPSNKEKRSDEPAASGSGSGGSPVDMNQMTNQWQNVFQQMNGGVPGMGGGKPTDGSSGSGGGNNGNPLSNVNQVTEQFQGSVQQMNNGIPGMSGGGNMPFLPSNKEKRSDEPAASGSTPSGSGGTNPLGNMNQMTSQWQNVMQNMNGLGGHMPFLPSNKEKRSDEPAASGSTPSGSGGSNPLGNMNQMTSQWQNVMQNMNGLGGHMPFLPSNKEKRSDEPAASGSTPTGSGGSNPLGNMNQMTSQWQNVMQNMNGLGGHMPFLPSNKEKRSDEPAASGSTPSGSGGSNPLGNMNQMTSQWQNVMQNMNGLGGHMPFLPSNKEKRSDEPAASGSGSGGSPVDMNQMTNQWQNVFQQMNGGVPGMGGGKPTDGSSGSGGGNNGNPLSNVNQVTEQFQGSVQQMNNGIPGMSGGGNMPFLPSNKEKRSDEPAASGSTPSGSGGTNPLGNMNQMTSQWQNVMQNMNGLGGHMPFLPSNKEKRSDEPAAAGSGSGGSPVDMNQMTNQWQSVFQQMNGGVPGMGGGKPTEGSSGSGGGNNGNPLSNVNQVTEQFQGSVQQMNNGIPGMSGGGNMPFLPSNKEKRSDEPAASGSTPSGSGGTNPLGNMNQMTSQWQNVMQNMNGLGGHMPFLPSNKEKRSDEPAASGSTPSGSGGTNPLGNMNQMTSQWQNVMQNMNGLGGHMPFLPSNKEKRSDEPAASGSGSGGSPVDMNQMTNQWQNVFQQMNGGVPGMGGGKPTEGSSGSGGGNNGNPLSNVNQVTEQFQGSVQQMNNGIPGMSGGGNMPWNSS